MAKRKSKKKVNRYSVEEREKALVLMTANPPMSLQEISDKTGIPKSTLFTWKNAAGLFDTSDSIRTKRTYDRTVADNERTVQVQKVVEGCWSLVTNSLNELNKRLNRAINGMDDIHALSKFILENRETLLGDSSLSKEKILALFAKLDALEIIKTSELTTIMGVALDKYNLLSGGVTQRVIHSFEDMPE